MISFEVDQRIVQDLEDDFMVNEDKTMYDFIGNDPVRAFYLGLNINKWFENIDRKQKYLYSKQARHNKDDLDKYLDQIDFWSKKFSSEDEDIKLVKLAEYIMNNIFWDEKTEDLDKVKMAFFFGNTIDAQQSKEDDKS